MIDHISSLRNILKHRDWITMEKLQKKKVWTKIIKESDIDSLPYQITIKDLEKLIDEIKNYYHSLWKNNKPNDDKIKKYIEESRNNLYKNEKLFIDIITHLENNSLTL